MILPSIPKDLIDALDRSFPEKSPDKGETYEQLMFRAGEASVIRWLKYHYKVQNEGEPE